MNWAMLDKVAFRRFLNGITSSPIAAFVEENHGGADNGIFRMCVQKCNFLFKPARKGNIVSVHSCHILTGSGLQTAVQRVIQPHILLILKENDFIGHSFLVCICHSVGVIP